MWLSDQEMQAFQALSYGDKWRVRRSVTRGQAPADWKLAPAAVELAEGYQRQRGVVALMRWVAPLLVIVAGYLAISDALAGDHLGLALNTVIFLGNVEQLLFNPATRPKNVARSLEASTRIAALIEPGLSDLGTSANKIVESPEGALGNDEASVRRLLGL